MPDDGNLVLCGPIVRRADRSSVSVFVATRRACTVELTVYVNDRGAVAEAIMTGTRATIALGPAGGAHVAVVTAAAPEALVWGGSYYYDLKFTDADRLGVQKRALGSIDPGINLPSDGILIGNRIISSGTSGKTSSKSVNNKIRTGRITWREVVTQ